MLIITREGNRKCRLSRSERALVALVCLRKNDTLRQLAAGFGISLGSAHTHVHAVIGHLAQLAPGLAAALKSADARYVLLYSPTVSPSATEPVTGEHTIREKHRQYGVNCRWSLLRTARSCGSRRLCPAGRTI